MQLTVTPWLARVLIAAGAHEAPDPDTVLLRVPKDRIFTMPNGDVCLRSEFKGENAIRVTDFIEE